MDLCFIDESGGFEAPASHPSASPLMVIAGLICDHARLPGITRRFLDMKRHFYPELLGAGHLLDHVLDEVKGATVRAAMRSSSRAARRRALGFLDDVVQLLEVNDVRLVGRVWIKAPALALNATATYTYAIQDIATHFNHFLGTRGGLGMMICDSRMHTQNSQVSHSLFTQKHKAGGDAYPWLAETPTFGHSVNHVGLQLADLMASAAIVPMAARTYCSAYWTGPHVDHRYDEVKTRWASSLATMQHRYRDAAGAWKGGIVVSDRLGRRSSRELFALASAPLVPVP